MGRRGIAGVGAEAACAVALIVVGVGAPTQAAEHPVDCGAPTQVPVKEKDAALRARLDRAVLASHAPGAEAQMVALRELVAVLSVNLKVGLTTHWHGDYATASLTLRVPLNAKVFDAFAGLVLSQHPGVAACAARAIEPVLFAYDPFPDRMRGNRELPISPRPDPVLPEGRLLPLAERAATATADPAVLRAALTLLIASQFAAAGTGNDRGGDDETPGARKGKHPPDWGHILSALGGERSTGLLEASWLRLEQAIAVSLDDGGTDWQRPARAALVGALAAAAEKGQVDAVFAACEWWLGRNADNVQAAMRAREDSKKSPDHGDNMRENRRSYHWQYGGMDEVGAAAALALASLGSKPVPPAAEPRLISAARRFVDEAGLGAAAMALRSLSTEALRLEAVPIFERALALARWPGLREARAGDAVGNGRSLGRALAHLQGTPLQQAAAAAFTRLLAKVAAQGLPESERPLVEVALELEDPAAQATLVDPVLVLLARNGQLAALLGRFRDPGAQRKVVPALRKALADAARDDYGRGGTEITAAVADLADPAAQAELTDDLIEACAAEHPKTRLAALSALGQLRQPTAKAKARTFVLQLLGMVAAGDDRIPVAQCVLGQLDGKRAPSPRCDF